MREKESRQRKQSNSEFQNRPVNSGRFAWLCAGDGSFNVASIGLILDDTKYSKHRVLIEYKLFMSGATLPETVE